ncbi:MAG TPA: HNH endonuclease signature motif containing protein, partial [Gaiellaceae bacterium]|nr:HNH endonuclease signature motif containing protein [Gaiellaceae bacterium]
MSEFCECGCGERPPLATVTIRIRGWVKGQPIRFVNGHRSRLLNPGHEVDPETGCWNWQGYVNPRTGYAGMVHYEGRRDNAHRVYYKKHRGPIPSGLELDHTCQNRRCVNPDHLEAVTRPINGRRRPTTKLTPQLVAQ